MKKHEKQYLVLEICQKHQNRRLPTGCQRVFQPANGLPTGFPAPKPLFVFFIFVREFCYVLMIFYLLRLFDECWLLLIDLWIYVVVFIAIIDRCWLFWFCFMCVHKLWWLSMFFVGVFVSSNEFWWFVIMCFIYCVFLLFLVNFDICFYYFVCLLIVE